MMGLMFYIRPDQDFIDALRFGLDYFKQKIGGEPVECIVNPATTYPDGLKIVIKAERYILIRNFWLIQEEKENETNMEK